MIDRGEHRRTIVFHSENGAQVGGSDFYLGRLIDGLDPQRWRVGLMVRPDYPLSLIASAPERIELIHIGKPMSSVDQEEGGAVSQITLPKHMPPKGHVWSRLWTTLPRTWRRDVGLFRDIDRVRRRLRAIQPDIFHTVDGGCQPAALGAHLAGSRVVVGYCGPPRQPSCSLSCRWIDARTKRIAAAHLVKSGYAAEAWSRQLGLDPRRMDVIPNGIALGEFDRACPTAVRADLKIPDDAIVVGMTARLNREKGAQVFADALPNIAHRFNNVWFVVAGDGPFLSVLRQAARSAGVEDRLRLLGFRSDIPRLTHIYDIAVVPSIVGETFGWVLLEAMAAGKPLVATQVGAIPEVLQHERQGLLVPPDDAARLAEAIERLVVDETLRQTLGRAGRATVEQNYTESLMIQRTIALYDRVLSDTPVVASEQPGNEERTVLC